VLLTSDQGAYTSQALTRWRHLARIRKSGLLLIYRPRRDERLSWPSWLTYSGRFTHIVVTRRLQAERRTGSVRRPKTGVLPTVLRNQPCSAPQPGTVYLLRYAPQTVAEHLQAPAEDSAFPAPVIHRLATLWLIIEFSAVYKYSDSTQLTPLVKSMTLRKNVCKR